MSKNDEPSKVIYVRVPASLHEKIRQKAFKNKMSINKMCKTILMSEANK